MKKILLSVFSICLLAISAEAQLPDGSIAPDWTATDINGNEHTLYDYLDEGYSVILDVSATWCGPCWNYHTSGALETVWEEHGPAGGTGVSASTTDNVMVFMFEADGSTTQADLEGTGANTTGDWITGTNYPIIDDDQIVAPYQIGYYPTIYTICPSRLLVESGQAGATDHYSYIDANCAAATEAIDAGILSYIGETTTCVGGTYTPAVKIQNLSASGTALESAEFSTYVDGVLDNTYTWSGNLGLYDTEDVMLPAITAPGVAFDVSVEISLAGDTGTDNNTAEQNVGIATGGDNNLLLTIQLDNWPEETGWEILDSQGNVIAGQAIGAYSGQTDALIEEEIVTNVDCFTLVMMDLFGDGFYASQWGQFTDGSFELTDSQGTVLVSGGGQEVWESRSDGFGVDQYIGIDDISALTFVNVYPNPANDNLSVAFNLDTESQVSLEMYNLVGEKVYVSAQQNLVGNNTVNIDVTSLSAGLYTMNMIVDGQVSTTKVTITR